MEKKRKKNGKINGKMKKIREMKNLRGKKTNKIFLLMKIIGSSNSQRNRMEKGKR